MSFPFGAPLEPVGCRLEPGGCRFRGGIVVSDFLAFFSCLLARTACWYPSLPLCQQGGQSGNNESLEILGIGSQDGIIHVLVMDGAGAAMQPCGL